MHTQRHRKIETEIQTDTHSEADGLRLQTDSVRYRQTDGQTEKQQARERDTQTEIQTEMHSKIQRYRQTDRHPYNGPSFQENRRKPA